MDKRVERKKTLEKFTAEEALDEGTKYKWCEVDNLHSNLIQGGLRAHVMIIIRQSEF